MIRIIVQNLGAAAIGAGIGAMLRGSPLWFILTMIAAAVILFRGVEALLAELIVAAMIRRHRRRVVLEALRRSTAPRAENRPRRLWRHF